MRDGTRGRQSGGLRWLGALVAIAAPLALNVSPAAAQDGVGSASARGTDPDATLGAGTVAAQFSAITNCDETQSTRPFYVRWTAGSTTNTFKKTGAATASTCTSEGDTSINEGTGTGLVNGSTPATVEWSFVDGSAVPGPDNVNITVTPDTGDFLDIAGEPQPLRGTPGGVWVFGELPWPSLLLTSLSGSEEVALGDPDGTGTALLQLDPVHGRVCWNIVVSNIELVIAAHIHAAPAGSNGVIVVPLGSGGLGCTEGVDRGLIEDIIGSPEQFYVNVHTPDFPAGALRGQLGP